MRRSLHPWRPRLLSMLVVSSLELHGRAFAQPTNESADLFERRIEAGDDAEGDGDLRAALAEYTSAYYGIPEERRAYSDGYFALKKAMLVHDRLWDEERDPDLLVHQRDMLRDFVDRVDADQDARAELDYVDPEELEKLRKKLTDLDSQVSLVGGEAEVPPPGTEAYQPPGDGPSIPPPELQETPPPSITEPMADLPSKRSRDRLGIGLLSGGGAVIVLGSVPLMIGAATPARAEAWLDDSMNMGVDYAPGVPETYLQENRERGRNLVITGAVVMTVGTALAIIGGTRLARKRRSNTDTALRPGPVRAIRQIVMQQRF